MTYALQSLDVFKSLWIADTKKLFECDGKHFHYLHLAYRHRHLPFLDCNAKQRTGCNDMVLRSIFTEIFQTVESFLTFLNFVKYH